MSYNCCVGEPDPNFITADIQSKIGEIYASLVASGQVDLILTSQVVGDGETLVVPTGGWRWIVVQNTSDTLTATFNGAVLATNATVTIPAPYGHLTTPEVSIIGNLDGVRVDYMSW